MALSWKKCYVNVPVNQTGIEEHETFDSEMKNIYSFEFSESEYSLLSDFFYEMNKNFNIIIDIFEEEVLENNNITAAINLLNEYISNINNINPELHDALDKLMKAFRKAEELSMPVYFDF